MAIPPVQPGAVAPDTSRPASTAPAPAADGVTPAERAKAQHNRHILEAQASLSLRSGDQSLQLTLRAAIDAINERLAPTLGENAIERAQEGGLDVSPEATAERILSLTTGMFGRYQEIHPELDTAEQAQSFIDIIRAGIEQGFAEAREILDGLEVLEGDVAANIDRTFTLVEEGLQRFLARFNEAPGDAEGA